MASTGAWGREIATVRAHTGEGDVCKLTLQAPAIAAAAVPGQFVNIHCTPSGSFSFDPLLRRPLSIARSDKDKGEILLIYRALGRGTQTLATAPVGQKLDLLGPLGTHFPDPAAGKGTLWLVGGGLGIPPMITAASWAAACGRSVQIAIGARSASLLAGREELEALGLPLLITTDDGSAGQRGLITGPLARALEQAAVGEVWACGPEPMLRAIKGLCAGPRLRDSADSISGRTSMGRPETMGECEGEKISPSLGITPCYLSLERHMACGFGACIGCTVPRADGAGFLKCCVDGPVISAREVDLG